MKIKSCKLIFMILKKLAKSAEKYADIVFNYEMCQMSYLECKRSHFHICLKKQNF